MPFLFDNAIRNFAITTRLLRRGGLIFTNSTCFMFAIFIFYYSTVPRILSEHYSVSY